MATNIVCKYDISELNSYLLMAHLLLVDTFNNQHTDIISNACIGDINAIINSNMGIIYNYINNGCFKSILIEVNGDNNIVYIKYEHIDTNYHAVIVRRYNIIADKNKFVNDFISIFINGDVVKVQ